MTPLFPDNRSAAVSMTYDDALNQHIDHAAVDLEKNGLRGTFFTPTVRGVVWASRRPEWADVARRGHELGNHTRNHPCAKCHTFVKPEFALETYDLSRMEQELLQASQELAEVDGQPVRTYAYTCCEDFVGPERTSYRPLVERLFPAARGIGTQLGDARRVDLSFVPSLSVVESLTLSELTGYVDRAIEAGGWAVFQFHGVGGGHRLNGSRENHQALCEYIASRKQDIYCGTFLDVAQQLRSGANRPWPAS